MAIDGDFCGADPVLVGMPPDIRQRFANRQFDIARILFRRPPDAGRRIEQFSGEANRVRVRGDVQRQ